MEDLEMGVPELRNPLKEFLDVVKAGDLLHFEEGRVKYDPDVRAGPEVYENRTLHVAALHGRGQIVERVLSTISSNISLRVVNAKDIYGYTPLHLAVREQHEDVVKILIASSWVLPDRFIGATSEVDEENKECDGFTPLHLAAETGNVSIVKLLLRRSVCLGDYSAYDPVNIRVTTWKGDCLLDIAKQRGHVQLVDLLECSDFDWLQSERAKNANSMNAVLVGAALVVASSFATWLQPPLGIPNPIPNPVTAHDKVQSRNSAIFFVYVALAFVFSVTALYIGTFSVVPFSGASLRFEVQCMRAALNRAVLALSAAISCLNFAFMFASILVFKKVAFEQGAASAVGSWIVVLLCIFCNIYISYFDSLLDYQKKGLLGKKLGDIRPYL